MTDDTKVYVEKGPRAPVVLGWFMILGGIVIAGMSFSYDVGVSTGTAAGLYGMPERLANSDKMAIRHMILACGLASFVAGWIALCSGLIMKAVERE